MGGQLQNPADFQLGDKIRIRSGPHTGVRGTVRSQIDGQLEVQVGENDIINVPINNVTNYSLAARRAWKAMPKRSGRPQGNKPAKRMVSMRIDPDVWDMLQEAAQHGLIPNREKAVNDWLRERITQLLSHED
ncbi:MAG TPA: hypothetical protein VEP90_17175 [Methylomirabilota bacterium]|nr:hypothetical protein [Methylomirabilota bacterium]